MGCVRLEGVTRVQEVLGVERYSSHPVVKKGTSMVAKKTQLKQWELGKPPS